MFPVIKISDTLYINTYSFTYVIAIIIALLIGYKEFKRYEIPLKHFPAIAFWTLLGGIIGNKIFFIIFFDWHSFIQRPFQTLITGSGGMHYGAEIFGSLFLLAYLIKAKINPWKVFDVGAISFSVSHAIGRVGCYGSGCCYGTQTNSIFGVTFPDVNHPVHPTQLYETVPMLLLFIVLWLFRKRIKTAGLIYLTYVIFYSTLRFIVEFYRADAYKFGLLSISPSQYIALSFGIFGITALIFKLSKLNKLKQQLNN